MSLTVISAVSLWPCYLVTFTIFLNVMWSFLFMIFFSVFWNIQIFQYILVYFSIVWYIFQYSLVYSDRMEYYLIVYKIVISTWTLGKKISDVSDLASCEEHYLELMWMWGFGSCEHSCFYADGKIYQNVSQTLTYGSLLRLVWTAPKCPADRWLSRYRLMISASAGLSSSWLNGTLNAFQDAQGRSVSAC